MRFIPQAPPARHSQTGPVAGCSRWLPLAVTLVAGLLVGLPMASSSAVGQALPGLQPLTLPPIPNQGPFPYQLDVPTGWQVHTDPEVPGLWIGPPGSHPAQGGELVYVRFSPVDLSDPAKVAQAIRSQASQTPEWSAPRVQVLLVEGGPVAIEGVWVEMQRPDRTTLVMKLPVGTQSVDFLASAPPAALEELRPLLTRVLESLRPVGAAPESPVVED